MKNPDKIIEGIINNTRLEHHNLPQDEQDEVIRRRIICTGCPHMSKNMIEAGLLKTTRDEPFCTMCGCPIAYKTASLGSNCGIEYWNSQNPKTPMELKWIAYKPNPKT